MVVFLQLAVVFLLALLSLPAQQPERDFTISTDVERVMLDISVKSPKGGYVSGLHQDDFQVFENGLSQKITEFTNSDEPVAVGLVMDDSGSMRFKRAELNTAGLAFVEASNPLDQIFVVNFNDRVRRGLPANIPFTDDINLLRAALSRDRPEGKTALYDAIAYALNHLESGRRSRKALIVVTDGGDNNSQRKLDELIQLIQEWRSTIYTVGIFDAEDPDRNPGVLKRIAKISGGECFLPQDTHDITSICGKIAKDIRHRYTIGYVPQRTSGHGGLRKIHVVAHSAEGGSLIVRTRTSYLLPEGSSPGSSK